MTHFPDSYGPGRGRRTRGRVAVCRAAAVLGIAPGLLLSMAGGPARAVWGARPSTSPAAATGGSLVAWGANNFGQLGDGTTNATTVPVNVSLTAGTTVTVARAGCTHSVALTSTGSVLAWGNNMNGQLGNGTTTNSDTPVNVQLPAGTTVKAIRAGCFFSLAVTSTGQVLAWGDNSAGQLGNGTTTGSDTPVKVKLPPGTTVKAVSGGTDYALALTSTGQVLAWGDNSLGQLGNGTTTSSHTPVKVKLPRGTKVAAVAAGEAHSLAITTTGKVLAWGDNSHGELGDGTTKNRHTPVPVKLPAGTTVKGLFGGCNHSVALTSTGKVLAWGDNSEGELGNGSTVPFSTTPVTVKVPKGTTVTAVGAGCEHDLALTSKGGVLAWGFNLFAELGNGTTSDSSLPVPVKLPAGLVATSIASGSMADHSLAIVHG